MNLMRSSVPDRSIAFHFIFCFLLAGRARIRDGRPASASTPPPNTIHKNRDLQRSASPGGERPGANTNGTPGKPPPRSARG